jgi:hypothetical protein
MCGSKPATLIQVQRTFVWELPARGSLKKLTATRMVTRAERPMKPTPTAAVALREKRELNSKSTDALVKGNAGISHNKLITFIPPSRSSTPRLGERRTPASSPAGLRNKAVLTSPILDRPTRPSRSFDTCLSTLRARDCSKAMVYTHFAWPLNCLTITCWAYVFKSEYQ